MADQQDDDTSRDDGLRDAAAADDAPTDEMTIDEPTAEPPAGESDADEAVSASHDRRSKPPKDRFDEVASSKRVGVHRVTARPRRFWYYLLAAVVGIALLTGAGVLLVQAIGSSVTELLVPEEPEPVVEQVKPELDPDATVAVLNGTENDGLGLAVAEAITQNEWGKIGFSEVAANREVEISAVFYTSVADEAMALGLANELGGVSIYQSYDYTKYGMQLVVLLGADYAGPGSEEAAE